MEEKKLDISIDADDMYRFQMYHIYHSGQGILSIVLGILSIVVAIAAPIMAPDRIQTLDIVFYAGVGIVFLAYYPVALKKKAPQLIKNSPTLSHPLHYTFDEKGITVLADEEADLPEGEDKAFLPWESIYKAVSTKEQLLIYSNKINAYILPLAQIEGYDEIKKLIVSKVPSHRVSLK